MSDNRLTVPTNPARALRELNRQADSIQTMRVDEPNLESENNTTIIQSDKPTDIPTDQQTSRQTNQPTDRPTNKPTSRQTNKQAVKHTNKLVVAEPQPEIEETKPARVDGRTLRVRQETADRTMVTSMRLAVPTIEALDEYCWKHRQRKQDVVQAALTMYFATS